MKFRSDFDIIGPSMIGPSSSHTAGAVRIGQLARRLFGRTPEKAVIHFFGSFAQTYQGHATDVAVMAGLMDFETDDPRIPDALAIAKERGIDYAFIPERAIPEHPNTLSAELTAGGQNLTATGISLGGGIVQMTEVEGFRLHLSGEYPALLIFHRDAYGTIAAVTQVLAHARVNINHMEVSRHDRGKTALMLIETDEKVDPLLLESISRQPNVLKTITLSV